MKNACQAIKRRTFLGAMLAGATQLSRRAHGNVQNTGEARPNVVFLFADQWRAQATGYAGDPNAHTPNLDRLAAQSVNFTHAVSGCPVCSPYRASLMTGQYWHTHGVFLNDVPLPDTAVTVAEAFRDAGYQTGYIGKWHLDGRGRMSFTTPEHRQGFQYWKALECTHEYNASRYYDDDPAPKQWDGYDAAAQTRDAQRYIQERAGGAPFALFLSWGPPHNPYETAPKDCRDRVREADIVLRPNVPPDCAEKARKDLAGYYAHILALDGCLGALLGTLEDCGIAENTILVFTSDHGDMLYSQGMQRKQKPYDESIRVPFLLRYPKGLGTTPRPLDWLINAPDIMPTLLGLCGITPPPSVEGKDLSRNLIGGHAPNIEGALLACITPFGEWTRQNGGRECRGIRTRQHTYVRDLNGPWLLFDNESDPYQQRNLCNERDHQEVQGRLDSLLTRILAERKDAFEPGDAYIKRFGYIVDATGTVPIHP